MNCYNYTLAVFMSQSPTDNQHDGLRNKVPTKIQSPRFRTIFPTAVDTLNSTPVSSTTPAPGRFTCTQSSQYFPMRRSLGWNSKSFKLSRCIYRGADLSSDTAGLDTLRLNVEADRNCYSIYAQPLDEKDSLSIHLYFDRIIGALVTESDGNIICIDFALVSDISPCFDKFNTKFGLTYKPEFANCTTLRLFVRPPLSSRFDSKQLTEDLVLRDPKCKIKFNRSSKLGKLDSFEQELREDEKFLNRTLNFQSRLSFSRDSIKRSYFSSPDSLFETNMKKTKPKKSSLKTVEVDISDEEIVTFADFAKHSPCGSRRSSRIQSKFLSVSSKEFSYVDPEFDENAKILFSFPEGEIDSVEISTYEEARLAPGVWLNDNLIDFDLKYIFSRLDSDVQSRVHVFNSFFYRRLSSAPMPSTVDTETNKKDKNKKIGFDMVRSWTRKINIFEKDFILVPICENLHWFLAIICYPKRMLSKFEVIVDLDPDSEKMPVNHELHEKTVILVFDSLGLTTGLKLRHVVNRLKSYLAHEAHDKGHGEAFYESCTGLSVIVPRQNNFSDCGCFLLEYAEKFLKGPPEDVFHKVFMARDTSEGLSGWFPPSLAGERRATLRKIINTMAEDYQIRSLSRPKPAVEDRSSDIEEIIIENQE